MLGNDILQPGMIIARKASIFTNEGRVFLTATAHAYGYGVTSNGVIVDNEGRPLDESHEDHDSIIMRAQRQAVAESSIGAEVMK